MNLSVKERLTLINQYQILEMVCQDDKSSYEKKIEILKSGFELEYGTLTQSIDTDILTPQSCREVLDILDMFRSLNHNFKQITDKSEIDRNDIQFKGFDGNNETKQWSYTLYLRKNDRYVNLTKSAEDCNSHFPMLPIYRRMLDEWNYSDNRNQLSKDDIIRIVNARNITNLINQNGASKDESGFDEMLENIYRERGRPQTETEEAIS